MIDVKKGHMATICFDAYDESAKTLNALIESNVFIYPGYIRRWNRTAREPVSAVECTHKCTGEHRHRHRHTGQDTDHPPPPHTHTHTFLGRSWFYVEFFFKRSAWTGFFFFSFFFFPRCVRRVEVSVRANCHVGQGANVSKRVWMSVRLGWECFLWLILFLSTCGCASVRACRSGYFEMFDHLGGHFEVFDRQRHFPSYFSLIIFPLCIGPWDPLSSLESTPVSI